MVTTRPDVVSESSRFMHTSAAVVEIKQIMPGAQVAMAVVVLKQDMVLPAETEHIDVATVEVTEQANVPVVVADAAVPVEVELAEVLSLVVEEAVEAELVVDSEVEDSEVVVADVLATVAVVDFAVVVFAVVLLAVVECVVLASDAVVESVALLLNSFSFSCISDARQS